MKPSLYDSGLDNYMFVNKWSSALVSYSEGGVCSSYGHICTNDDILCKDYIFSVT